MLSKIKTTLKKFLKGIWSWAKNKSNFNHHILAAMLLITVALVVMFSTSNPNTIGPVGILTTLVFVYSLFFTIILYFRNKGAGKFTTYEHKKQLLFRSALDATPLIILVGLNTLRQVTLEDLLIVPILYLAFKFYAHRQLGL